LSTQSSGSEKIRRINQKRRQSERHLDSGLVGEEIDIVRQARVLELAVGLVHVSSPGPRN